jgi:hypothetical protein
MGISEEYPVALYGTPFDGVSRVVGLGWKELNAVGFPRDDPEDLTVVDQHGNQTLWRDMRHFCLTVDEKVVALWDEGRWWTPAENEAFVTILRSPLMKQLAEATAMNRAQRRSRKRKK